MRLLFAALIMAPVQAGAFSLDWPVDCVLGETCHIQQVMDRDPGPGAQDFTCAGLTYDGHKGTDIALPTLAEMRAGVVVRAAADGVVTGLRDGMPDISFRDAKAPSVEGRECGNGLVIDHGDGWETQYCHLARGSLLAQKGAPVKTGDPLGLIGLSGQTEFPHLHLSVRRNGTPIDPFDPDGTSGCGPGPKAPLWSDDVSYMPGGLTGIGLAPAVPEWEALKAGLPQPPLTERAPALVVWARYFGNRSGDRLQLSITAPDGSTLIAESILLERAQAQGFRAIGRKQSGAIPRGTYGLRALLIRDGVEIDSLSSSIQLD